VAAVLGDEQRRLSVLGGREGMARSLGSVLGASVTRFLGPSLRGVVSRVIATTEAVRRDGSTGLMAQGGPDALTVDGSRDSSRVHLDAPQVCITPDAFVFVADRANHRVRVLTPSLDFHGFIGADRQLIAPYGVCANADIVVVSEGANRISVFNRGDGTLARRFGEWGAGDGQFDSPQGLCLTTGHGRIAVADCYNNRVSVFSVDGAVVRHVGVGALRQPVAVACSAADELVVADSGNDRVAVFCSFGDLARTIALGLVRVRHGYGYGYPPPVHCTSVAVYGGAIFAQRNDGRCTVIE
jgi:DNA-binding beta-propeller fold protein YncE